VESLSEGCWLIPHATRVRHRQIEPKTLLDTYDSPCSSLW
jgi:hypothetical protein